MPIFIPFESVEIWFEVSFSPIVSLTKKFWEEKRYPGIPIYKVRESQYPLLKSDSAVQDVDADAPDKSLKTKEWWNLWQKNENNSMINRLTSILLGISP